MKIETEKYLQEVERVTKLIRVGTPKKEVFKDFKIPLLEFLAAVVWFRPEICYSINSFAVYSCNYSSSLILHFNFGVVYSTELKASWYSETFEGVLRNLAYYIIFIYGTNLFDSTKSINDCKNFKTIVKQKSKRGEDKWGRWKRVLESLNSQGN